MAHIMTVLGPLDPKELGPTLMHEHLFIDLSGRKKDPDTVLDDLDLACEEVAHLQRAGGRALVEVTCHGMGRRPELLREVARRTGLQVVAATGFYQQAYHPPYVAERSAEELAELLMRDIQEGMDGTDVKPGILAEIGTSKGEIRPDEAKVFRAVALVHKWTGLPISTHCTLGTMGLEQLDLLESLGVDPARVVIGHQDLTDDLETHVALARRGATVAYDTAGKESYMPDAVRVRLITGMLERGLADRVVLSMDVTRRSHLKANGGYGYSYLFDRLVPTLRAAGVSEAELEQMLVLNPRRILTVA
ncbi:phosphotriesterase family protein [Symbiobacterium thermophilum]|uniref:phosphotriesterase family protein n=1 Tax=Symbiobacterium thermophilum TaxID=2734 RepID=UPI0035C676D9